MRNSIITCFLLIYLANSYISAAAEPTIEQLFKDALDAKGQAYIDVRQKILNLSPQNDSFLKEQAKSADLQTRIIAQAILERAAKPQEYRHFEELMIVPITHAVKYGQGTVTGAKPFATITQITQKPAATDSSGSQNTARNADVITPSETNFNTYCHDDSAFLFLAEMALKNSMLDVPELSEQIEWTDEQKTYTPNEAAVMLGVLPQTAEKWHKARLFLSQRNQRGNQRVIFPLMQMDTLDLNTSIIQYQIRNFYEYFSDKIINPEYLKSTQPVSRVVHSDAIYASELFQQDPGILFRCYAVLMLNNFSNQEIPELLYEIYKDDTSENMRAFCVEGFSAQTQVEQIREAMKAFYIQVQSNNNSISNTNTTYNPVKPPENVPYTLLRKAAVIKSKENLDAFEVFDYIESIIPGNDRLNQEIAQALSVKGDIAAIEPLIEMYRDNVSINSEITKAIIAIDPNSIYKALEYEDIEIQNKAWSSLASYDVNFPIKLEYLEKHLNGHSYTTMRLIEKYHPESLVSFLGNTDPEVRVNTVDLLLRNPEKYIQNKSPSLKELLLLHVHDPASKVRRSVLRGLQKYRYDRDIQAVFIEALKDTDSECKMEAIKNLNGSQETVSILEIFLSQEKNQQVRRNAAYYLSLFREPSKYKVLAKLVYDESYDIREISADGLSDWEDNQAVELLKFLLNDSNLRVQQAAILSIAQRDIRLLPEIISIAGPELRRAAYISLGQDKFLIKGQTNEAIDLLIEGTKDPNAEVRNSAMWGLTKQKNSYELDHPAVLAIQKCLADKELKIRSNAMYILYEMTGEKSIELIAGYLYDSDRNVKMEAIRSLARPKSKAAIEYLMEALTKEEDKETLVELVISLREITGNLLTKDEWMQWWSENKDTYLKTEK